MGTFLWQVLFVELGTEETVICLQCNVICKKLCSCLENVSPLHRYFLVSL